VHNVTIVTFLRESETAYRPTLERGVDRVNNINRWFIVLSMKTVVAIRNVFTDASSTRSHFNETVFERSIDPLTVFYGASTQDRSIVVTQVNLWVAVE